MKRIVKKFIRRTTFTRMIFFMACDAVLLVLACWLAFFLRFDGTIPTDHLSNLEVFSIIVPVILISIFFFRSVYRLNWTYFSVRDLISLLQSLTIGFFAIATFIFIFHQTKGIWGLEWVQIFPRSTVFISYVLSVLFISALRISKRIYMQLRLDNSGGRRLLIVGAGDAGEQILRNILNNTKESFYLPVGFVDDIVQKKGTLIHGFPILGKLDDIGKIIKNYSVEEIIIALPSANSILIRKAVEQGREAEIKNIKILPSLSELISGGVSLSDLRDVRVDDLLGRDPVRLDTKDLEDFIQGKIVLITGAAGSIGSELCRQITKFNPKKMIMIDQDETAIFWLSEEFREKFPHVICQNIICDILDKNKLENIFKRIKPQVVFHSAAYKHVPLMEENIDEAIKNNVEGTKNLADMAVKYGVEKFVLISTDKAVNPVSVMGATKRLAELVVSLSNNGSRTNFVAVRFGNVLDSRGSIIPILKKQIRKGGPVKITHPEMERFFMSIPEAALLVMEAAAIGDGGKIYVLDMGKPIKIIELARELIRLSGFEPDKDIPILLTSPRPGEKLSEELLNSKEKTEATKHKKIFEIKTDSGFLRPDIPKKIDNLIKLVGKDKEGDELRERLWEIINL